MGDPGRLKQVLGNLLSNAVKFTATGQVTLRILAGNDSGAGIAAARAGSLRGEDSGIGIAPDVAERLFQPFTQADASTTRCFGGTRPRSGDLQAPGRADGRAHRAAQRARQRRPVLDRVAAGESTTSSLHRWPPALPSADRWTGCRALLVEDNPINMIVAETQLERLGLEVTTADRRRAGARRARQSALRHRPHGLPDAAHGRLRGRPPLALLEAAQRVVPAHARHRT